MSPRLFLKFESWSDIHMDGAAKALIQLSSTYEACKGWKEVKVSKQKHPLRSSLTNNTY